MHSLERYIKESGYVSKWWKRCLLLFLAIDAVAITTIAGCFDGFGDLNEAYFKINDRYFYIGFME